MEWADRWEWSSLRLETWYIMDGCKTGPIVLSSQSKRPSTMPMNPYPAQRDNRNDNDTTTPRTVLQCLIVKQQIIRQLIEGRLELVVAASRFHAVHRIAAACIERATGMPSSASDGENLCRTV